MSLLDASILAESVATGQFEKAVRAAINEARAIWGWGDGDGGYLVAVFKARMKARGMLQPVPDDPIADREASVSELLETSVMERDMYRCRHCATHLDLSVEHIVAEVNGGPTVAENLQVLCKPCSSKKGRT